LDKYH